MGLDSMGWGRHKTGSTAPIRIVLKMYSLCFLFFSARVKLSAVCKSLVKSDFCALGRKWL